MSESIEHRALVSELQSLSWSDVKCMAIHLDRMDLPALDKATPICISVSGQSVRERRRGRAGVRIMSLSRASLSVHAHAHALYSRI